MQAPPPRHCPGYAQPASISINEGFLHGAMEYQDSTIGQNVPESEAGGLGINVHQTKSPTTPKSVCRVPVGSKTDSEQQTPQSARSLVSPFSASMSTGSTKYDPIFADNYRNTKHAHQQSMSSLNSLNSTNAPSLSQTSTRNLLPKDRSVSFEVQFDHFRQKHYCHSARHFKKA